MKSTHNKAEQASKEITYPCLMVTEEGKVVLFNAHEEGTVLVSTNNMQPIGRYSENWIMRYFTPLPPTESITLQND